jgi:hypothetical protein
MQEYLRISLIAALCLPGAVGAQANIRLSEITKVFSDDDGTMGLDEWSQLGVGPRNTTFMLDAKREGIFLIDRPGASPIRIGRKGSGPGEYVRVSGFGWLGDTLWVSDDATRRLTFVDQLGRGRVRTQGFTGAVTTHAFMTLPLALTPDGTAICGILDAKRSPGVDLAKIEPLGRIARSSVGAWDTLMLLNARHRRHEYAMGGGHWTGTQPMSDATLWAVSRNGKYAVKIDRSDEAPLQSGLRVTLSSTQGTGLYSKTFERSRDAVSDADVDAIVQRAADLYKRPATPRGMPAFPAAQFRASLYRPKFRIAFTAVVLGDDGTVLLRGNDWNSKAVLYTWLTPSGTIRGTFTVPVSQHVRAVLGDYLWSVSVDADGAGTLVQQRVR